jgi:hypothetical protein
MIEAIKRLLTFLAIVAIAALATVFVRVMLGANPRQEARTLEARIAWVENGCEGFGPGDCSVRQPKTAQVLIEFTDGTIVRLTGVPCRTKGCKADEDELAEWIRIGKDRAAREKAGAK